MPDEFVPLAEQAGLIRTLTRWVLEQSLAQCRTWRDAGLPLRVAVAGLTIRRVERFWHDAVTLIAATRKG